MIRIRKFTASSNGRIISESLTYSKVRPSLQGTAIVTRKTVSSMYASGDCASGLLVTIQLASHDELGFVRLKLIHLMQN